jgi:hypothetical protein
MATEWNPAPELPALLPDEILVAIKRPEGYEDVAPELVAEDARIHPAFGWRVIDPFALAAARGQEGEDAARLDWLEANELSLVTHREGDGEDGYTIWWSVVRVKRCAGRSSGHPLGDLRAAIDAAMKEKDRADLL